MSLIRAANPAGVSRMVSPPGAIWSTTAGPAATRALAPAALIGPSTVKAKGVVMRANSPAMLLPTCQLCSTRSGVPAPIRPMVKLLLIRSSASAFAPTSAAVRLSATAPPPVTVMLVSRPLTASGCNAARCAWILAALSVTVSTENGADGAVAAAALVLRVSW